MIENFCGAFKPVKADPEMEKPL